MSARLTMRRLRREKGLTQRELAARLGVSPETIRAWEAGEHIAHPGNAKRLAEALDTTVTELFPLEDDQDREAA